MTSAVRQIANAANAQLSAGPRVQSAYAVELLIPVEDSEELEALHAGYENEIHPQGASQQTLFNELVASAWNLRRIGRMEAELLNNTEILPELDRLGRRRDRLERAFYRCLHQLKALQTNDARASPTEIAKMKKRSHSRPFEVMKQ